MINCPNCNRIIMDTTQNGGYKLRSRMIIFEGDKTVSICPTCKTHVEVPIKMTESIEITEPKSKIVVNK